MRTITLLTLCVLFLFAGCSRSPHFKFEGDIAGLCAPNTLKKIEVTTNYVAVECAVVGVETK